MHTQAAVAQLQRRSKDLFHTVLGDRRTIVCKLCNESVCNGEWRQKARHIIRCSKASWQDAKIATEANEVAKKLLTITRAKYRKALKAALQADSQRSCADTLGVTLGGRDIVRATAEKSATYNHALGESMHSIVVAYRLRHAATAAAKLVARQYMLHRSITNHVEEIVRVYTMRVSIRDAVARIATRANNSTC